LLAGVPVKIVTDATLMKPPGPGVKNSMHLLVRKGLEGQVRSVSDLRGRKVAINNLGTLNQIQMSKLLATGGLTLDDVDIAQVPFPDQMAALANGAVDAGLTVEPFITQADARNIAVPFFDIGLATPN